MRSILSALLVFSLLVSSGEASVRELGTVPQDQDAEKGSNPQVSEVPFPTGNWRAWLFVGDKQQLHFEFEVEKAARGYRTFLKNGDERIEVPRTQWLRHKTGPGVLRLAFPHFDSAIRGVLSPNKYTLKGFFVKRMGNQPQRRLHFMARHEEGPRFPPVLLGRGPADISGRWQVSFDDSDQPAIMLLEQKPDSSELTGTVLTTTGDYRFLAGSSEKGFLRLSAFDGAHAFLFFARWNEEEEVFEGLFKNGDWYKTDLVLKRTDDLRLPDPLLETTWHEGVQLVDLSFPNLSGEMLSLVDRRFADRPMILNLFGTWCPNCHDEAELLNSLFTSYSRQGLSIVGLAFEFPGEAQRSVDQVAHFRLRHGTQYPTVIAGNTPKSSSTRAFGAIDRLRSYPTSIFVRRDGTIAGVHTGFIGPAAGEEHLAERERFERLTREILASKPYDTDAGRSAFGDAAWQAGGRRLELSPEAVLVPGGAWIADELWKLDLTHGLAWRADDPDVLVARPGRATLASDAKDSQDARARTALLAQSALEGHDPLDDATLSALLEDPAPSVQAMAAWVAGKERRKSFEQVLAGLASEDYPPLAREARRALERIVD